MPVLEAEERLKGPVADEELYDLVQLVTGSKDAAAAALSDRIAARLRRNEAAEV